MKASILKALDELESAAKVRSRPPLALVDVHTWPDDDRDAYWAAEDAGDVATVDDLIERRTGRRPGPTEPGEITMVVISLGVAGRERWLATRHMDDDALEADEERRVNDQDRAEREAQRQKMRDDLAAVRAANLPPHVWGYDPTGYPIMHGDPRAVGTWQPR